MKVKLNEITKIGKAEIVSEIKGIVSIALNNGVIADHIKP